ncbi:MAG: tRNA (adenosine(37)-N6)-threonylcarbamoyltransferase complex ATPase subunit type 1 TsaE [Candidatus Peregrinibacteria bacterium]|nr:tRNA (adenosine(37)-N6)-threonylcarbamoyltransferase complex ATPase subunit type 1 TsaE [Candidatus Peregrinibacteria bacterium]
MISKSPAETVKLAFSVAKKSQKGGLICLYGDLGTGKTTFTKGFMKELGIDNFSVKSPTYTYVRQYKHPKTKIYHIDLYRLDNVDQLLVEEIQEILDDRKNIVVIEWADKLDGYLEYGKKTEISFKYLDEESREINVKYE